MHAYIISELKSRMPMISKLIRKNKYQNDLINNLEHLYSDIQAKYKNLSMGDFPDVKHMKVSNDNQLA